MMELNRRIRTHVACALVSLLILEGCIHPKPAWISETPRIRPCGIPTKFFEYSLSQGSFEDVFQLPSGVLFCSTEHHEDDDPRPESSGRVTIITFALTNPTSQDYEIGGMSKFVSPNEYWSGAVDMIKDGYIEDPEVVKAGETVMMRFVYKLDRQDWMTASGSFGFGNDFGSDRIVAKMIGLE